MLLTESERVTRKTKKSEKEPTPSRFLTAIPLNLAQFSETDPLSEEARRMDAARKLFNLFR